MTRIAVCSLTIVLLAAALGLAADTPAAGTVNINTAGAEQLTLLPRIGPTAAARIIEYRKANGPFAAPEGLLAVKGIGEKTLELLRPYVIVRGETTLKTKVHLPRKAQG